MRTEKISIEQIKFAPYNPRKIKSEELEKLVRSIKTYNIYEPLIVNSRNWHVVGGNQRLRALLELGYKEVDIVLIDLPLEKEKLLNLALNRIQGEWDFDKLPVLINELYKIPDIDLGLSGFDSCEIDKILENMREPKDPDDFDVEATLEKIKEPITKRGDLIQLGPHRILCGDSSNHEDIKTLMGDEKADALDCDFPYNVNYGGGSKPNPNSRPKNSRKWPQIYSDDMPQAEYEAWMKKVLVLIKQYLKPGAAIYIWQGLRQFPPMYQILLELDFHVSCILCWLKESAALTYADYCYRTEQCLYGWLKGATHYWAGKPGESNVWEVKRDPTKSYLHPTQKPVQLARQALQNSSKIGDIVLDTFLGSGSVLIGAESLGRCCFGLELSEAYCDVVVRRYLAYAGKDNVSQELIKKYLPEVTNG